MNKIIILGGPTASGKSKLAISIAKNLNGEIINGDSMQVYKYFPILTSQPKYKDLKIIPHHLYGFIETNQNYNAIEWLNEAKTKIDNILSANKIPIIVGGSGLYLEFLIEGVSYMPKISDISKKKAQALINSNDKKSLLKLLMKIDKKYANKINISDTFRILKLLEVYSETKKNISYFHDKKREKNQYNCFKVLMFPDKEEVKKNIGKRVSDMLDEGIIEEIKKYKNKVKNCNLEKAIGFREFGGYINNEIHLEEAIDLVVKNTKRFAKRQYTWFENRFAENLRISNNTKYSLVVESFLKII